MKTQTEIQQQEVRSVPDVQSDKAIANCCAPKHDASNCCKPLDTQKSGGPCCVQPDDGTACCDK